MAAPTRTPMINRSKMFTPGACYSAGAASLRRLDCEVAWYASRMRYRRLGQSDLEISEIGLGSWLTFGVDVDADQGAACIRRALDLGVNFIDTANVYGRGAAESFLGEVLAGVDRSSYVL